MDAALADLGLVERQTQLAGKLSGGWKRGPYTANDGTQRGALRLDSGATINGSVTLNADAGIDANTGVGTTPPRA